jgi:hypothetical protein
MKPSAPPPNNSACSGRNRSGHVFINPKTSKPYTTKQERLPELAAVND